MPLPRLKDYTNKGITRVPCAVKGCKNKGFYQWNICVTGKHKHAICQDHDIELNAMVSKWAFGDRVSRKMMKAYAAKVQRQSKEFPNPNG